MLKDIVTRYQYQTAKFQNQIDRLIIFFKMANNQKIKNIDNSNIDENFTKHYFPNEQKKEKFKHLIVLYLFSIVSIALSVFSICSNDDSEYKNVGFLTTALTVLVTVLIGWNIYTLFDFKNEVACIKDLKKNINNSINDGLAEAYSCMSIFYEHYAFDDNINKNVGISGYLYFCLLTIVTSSHCGNYHNCNLVINEILAREKDIAKSYIDVKTYSNLCQILKYMSNRDKMINFDKLESLINNLKLTNKQT